MTAPTQPVPLMWTIDGNVPVDSLTYNKEWSISDDLIRFEEMWHFPDGRLARNNVHLYVRKAPQLLTGCEQATIS